FDPKGELNVRSAPQRRKWCADRGVRATSFDQLHVEKLLARVEAEIEKLLNPGTKATKATESKITRLTEVRVMLRMKQNLGGSSLSKLPKVLDLVSSDGRLRDQYVHVGAGQTFRTSSRGAQMQN